MDTPGIVRILPTSDQKYFLISRDHIIKVDGNGSLETDFGDEGYLETDLELLTAETDNDQNIVVAARVYNYSPTDIDYDYMLSRFDQNGVQDLSFGENGLAYPVDTLGSQSFTNIAIDSQGRIVSVGRNYVNLNEFNLLAARTMPDGTPDTDFGDDGLFIESYSNRSRGNALHVDSDDNVILGGNAKMSSFGNWGVFLVKFSATGTMDASFGDGGFKFKEVPGDGYPNRIHRLQDNSLLITGNAFSEFLYMAKFQPDGDSDFSFGDDGIQTMEAFEFSGSATDSELYGNSVIICANSFYNECAQSKWKAVFMKYKVGSSDVEIVANTPDNISVCTSSPYDTTAVVDLESNLSQIAGEQTGIEVSFFNHPEDAENGVNAIEFPGEHEIGSLSQQIFVRVESAEDTDQFATTAFYVYLKLPPEITPPAPHQTCDDNFDGFAVFDLASAADAITGDLEDVFLTYFTTEQGAQSGDSNEQIEPLYTNQTAGIDTVWIRAEGSNGCSSVTDLTLVVNPLPQYSLIILNISLCDQNSDTLEVIDLTAETQDLFGSIDTDTFQVAFFQSQTDAEQNTDAIESPEDYEVADFNHSIYIGIENTATGCYAQVDEPLAIYLNPLPVDTSFVSDYTLCDEDFDGFEHFDLTSRNFEILGGQDSSVFQTLFFTNQEDAFQNFDPIENVSAYLSDSPNQTIYAGILNSETGCFRGGGQSFDIFVHDQPQIVQAPETLVQPQSDVEVENEATFNLTLNNDLMLGDQDTSAFQFAFFESPEDAADGINQIENPQEYTNLSNPQTIYVAMHSPDWHCVSHTFFDLLVDQGLSAVQEHFAQNVNVFPNPATHLLRIDCGSEVISDVSILNLQGKVVLVSENNPREEKIGMDVSQLVPGLYIVRVRVGKAMVNKKIIIL